jgi:radical SAM protein with 4Fe4S-binding SPASM domain
MLNNKQINKYSIGKLHLFKKSLSIEQLDLELTHRCNLKCIMCNLSAGISSELSLNEIKGFVGESKYLKSLKKVLLTGGEPFFRSDIADIAGFFIGRYPGISIGIFSNLFDTNKVLAQTRNIMETYAYRDLWINSSLDGIGKTHDIIRRRKGAFKHLLKTLEILHKEMPDLPCGLVFTITPQNYREMLDAFNLAAELDCSFSAQFAIQYKGVFKHSWTTKQLNSIERQADVIIEKLSKNINKISPLFKRQEKNWHQDIIAEIFFWKYLVKYQKKPKRYLKYCLSGRSYIRCEPNGNIYLCPPNRDMIIGNIKESKFDRLWESNLAQTYRDFIDRGKCHCWHLCSVIPVAKRLLIRGYENA